jgi:L-amino acid N-acyltransferase YncA
MRDSSNLPTPVVRLAVPDDGAAIQEIYAPHCSDGYASFEDSPPSVAEMRARIETGSARYPWLVVESDGIIAGYVYASEHSSREGYRWSCNTSVYLHDTARGSGYGKVLYLALLKLLTAQGFVNAYAGIALPNPASVALHESVGFVRMAVYESVGWKLDKWLDVGWWLRRLNEPQNPPPEPLTMAQLGAEWLP